MSGVTSEVGGGNQSQYVTERYKKKDNNSWFPHGLIVGWAAIM
jgi:hypothetical protein